MGMGVGGSCMADKLFDAVCDELKSEDRHLASKITGMLLEVDPDTVEEMLTSQTLLRSAVEKTKTSLKHIEYDMKNDLCDLDLDNATECDFGDLLYEKVLKRHPNMAQRITGILLEMDKDSLKQLICSEILFEIALDKATKAINSVKTERQFTMCLQDETDSQTDSQESIGDLVYEKVEKVYPSEASKITGMLLELDENTMKDLLNNEDQFNVAVRRAVEVILKDS